MLIDQFTEEELAQIKRELKLTQGVSKSAVGEDIRDKLGEMFDFKSYSDFGLYPYRKVGDSIAAIVNYTLDNFVYLDNRQGKGNRLGWYVNNIIPQEKYDEYVSLSNELIDVIKKHRPTNKCTLKKKES